jgi:hypothetical protein
MTVTAIPEAMVRRVFTNSINGLRKKIFREEL